MLADWRTPRAADPVGKLRLTPARVLFIMRSPRTRTRERTRHELRDRNSVAGSDMTLAIIAQAVRFLSAGAAATACHYAFLVVLVEIGLLQPVPASCVGYAASAALNYWLRYRFVFRSRVPHRRSMPRYLVAVMAGFLLNGAVMKFGIAVLSLSYGAAQVPATAVTLGSNFAVDRLWTFRNPRPGGRRAVSATGRCTPTPAPNQRTRSAPGSSGRLAADRFEAVPFEVDGSQSVPSP